jgi:hypothetical protein
MSKPSLLRKEMEDRRIEMKGKLNAVEVELVQIPNTHFKSEECQRLNSTKRLLIKELNKLTIGIKNIMELESDPNVVKQMDDIYKKLESGEMSPSDLQNMVVKMEGGVENDDDTPDWLTEVDDDENEDSDTIEPKKEEEDEKGVNTASDDDISQSVDDLLDNL